MSLSLGVLEHDVDVRSDHLLVGVDQLLLTAQRFEDQSGEGQNHRGWDLIERLGVDHYSFLRDVRYVFH